MPKKFMFLMLCVFLATGLFAQLTPATAGRATPEQLVAKDLTAAAPYATTACQSTYTSGSGLTYFKFCVTANGNIVYFEAPLGFVQSFPGEGYGICDRAFSPVNYYDTAINGDSGNWLPSVITQPNGPNTFPLTITRTTSDGIWRLTQAFARNTTDRYVKVTMTFKNLSGVGRFAWFDRYFDVDADNSASGDIVTQQLYSVQAWQFGLSGSVIHGVELAAIPSVYAPSGYGGIVSTTGGNVPCSPNIAPNDPFSGDVAMLYYWGASTVPAGGTRKFIFYYRAL
jgi:hypothetical protein